MLAVPLVMDPGWALRQSHDNYIAHQCIQTSLRMITLQAVDGRRITWPSSKVNQIRLPLPGRVILASKMSHLGLPDQCDTADNTDVPSREYGNLAPSVKCRQGLLVLPLASSRCG